MKLLIEQSLLSKQDEINFNKKSNYEKLKFLDQFIERLPNYNNFKESKEIIKENILEQGFDPERNPFLKYILKIKYSVNLEQLELIETLMKDKKLKPEAKWLYLKSLYEGSNEDILFKIKALTFADTTETQRFSNKRINSHTFINSKGVMSAASIKRYLNKWQTKSDPKEKGLTGVEILRSVLTNYTFEDIKTYILTLFKDDENKAAIKNYLNTQEFKSKLTKILNNTFKDNVLGDDIQPLDLLNNQIKDLIDNSIEKNKPEETKKDENKGFNLLRKVVDPYTYQNIVDYILKLFDNEDKKSAVRDYLYTNKGRTTLTKLLNKDYKDNILGDDTWGLDLLKDDLIQTLDDIQPSVIEDVIQGLINTGVSQSQAKKLAVKNYKQGMSTQELLSLALKDLGKSK